MKRLAATVVILMLGILPAAAESTSTQPIRGVELDAMVREALDTLERLVQSQVAAMGSRCTNTRYCTRVWSEAAGLVVS